MKFRVIASFLSVFVLGSIVFVLSGCSFSDRSFGGAGLVESGSIDAENLVTSDDQAMLTGGESTGRDTIQESPAPVSPHASMLDAEVRESLLDLGKGE